MVLYYLIILVLITALVVAAHLAGLVEPSERRKSAAFWISIATVLFLGLVVLPNT